MKLFPIGFAAFLFLVGIAVISMDGASVAQEHGNQAQASDNQTSIEGELDQEENEAEGHNALKESASVKFLAKVTGLTSRQAYWLALILNFAIIVAVFVALGRKRLPAMFQNRTASIQRAMEEARKASADANRRLSEIEVRLSKLDVEIGTMQAQAEKEMEAEEGRITAAAEEETRKIVELAEQEIGAAVKQARRDLKAYAANLAVTMAEKRIKVDPATDEALVQRFAAGLAKDGNASEKGN